MTKKTASGMTLGSATEVVAKAVKQEGWGFTACWSREGVNRRLREERRWEGRFC
jgi:hypothetical protein